MSYFYSSSFVESLGRQHLHSVLPEHAWLLCALHNSDSNRVWLFIDSTRKSISIRACWICCMYTDHVICLSWHWGKNCLHNIFTIVAICLIKKKKERRKKKIGIFLSVLRQSVRLRCSYFQITWTKPNCTCPWHNCNAQCSSRWSEALSVKTVFVGCFTDCVWDSNLGHKSSPRKDTRLLLLFRRRKKITWIVILREITIMLNRIHRN